jgi:hypothetical protein
MFEDKARSLAWRGFTRVGSAHTQILNLIHEWNLDNWTNFEFTIGAGDIKLVHFVTDALAYLARVFSPCSLNKNV